jgi:hypothetical protein
MRSVSISDSPDPALPALRTLALILAGVAALVWGVANLTLGLTLLVPGAWSWLYRPLRLVLVALVLACRSWPDWRWGWLCGPDWFREPWSWLYRSWLRWPWLFWRWLSQPRHEVLRGCFNRIRLAQ